MSGWGFELSDRSQDSLASRINVHFVAAQEPDQRLVVAPRKFDGQTRRRRNSRDDRDTGSERFLHHLEGYTTAEKQDLPIQR